MTTQQRQPPRVTRYAVFTVGETNQNEYGDLIVKDTQGNEYKIGNKRAKLFDIFQVGAEVKVGYAVYMQKEYIASAEQTGKHMAEVETVEKTGVEVASVIAESPKAEPKRTTTSYRDEDRTDARTAAMEIGEDWRAGKLQDNNALTLARKVWLLKSLGISDEEIRQAQAKFKTQS